MNLSEQVLELQKRFPELGRRAVYDMTDKGESFCELVYPNPAQQSLPLTLTVFDDGTAISLGKIPDVAGGKRLPIDAAICAVDDIIHDRIIFVFQYASRSAMESSLPIACDAFVMTEGEGDMRTEYDDLMRTLRKPLSAFGKLFSSLKGIFVITDFSGSRRELIER